MSECIGLLYSLRWLLDHFSLVRVIGHRKSRGDGLNQLWHYNLTQFSESCYPRPSAYKYVTVARYLKDSTLVKIKRINRTVSSSHSSKTNSKLSILTPHADADHQTAPNLHIHIQAVPTIRWSEHIRHYKTTTL